MNEKSIKHTVEFTRQEAADLSYVIKRNMENPVFIHKLLVSARLIERLYVLEVDKQRKEH